MTSNISDEDRETNGECDSDSDSDSDGKGISLVVGLSPEALAALFKFVVRSDDDASTADNMSEKISESLDQMKPDPLRASELGTLEASSITDAFKDLRKNGVIRLNGILSTRLCDECLVETNRTLLAAQGGNMDHFVEGKETGFGNVDAKERRWDMFMPHHGCFLEAVASMMNPDSSALATLFAALFGGSDAEFFEYAALVSDSGSLSQRMHSDTTFQHECPVYTVFVALQDVASDMGPTLFLPGSHTQAAHQEFRRSKHQWLSNAQYLEGTLRRGDAVVMDSRTFHCGSANQSSQRRALFYFSLLNPLTASMGGGSIFADMSALTLHNCTAALPGH